MNGWTVRLLRGSAAEIHERAVPQPPAREIWLCELTEPTLVLGSTQPDDLVDGAALARAGIGLVRRRSGGGAVLLEPGRCSWVDVVVPAGDVLWSDDIGRAFHWLGECWAAALLARGVGDATVHTGPLVRTRWSSTLCFAGIGAGEVLVGGRKVVGLSQRRTRHAARFQGLALDRWEPAVLAGFLRLDAAVDAVASAVADAATGVDLHGLTDAVAAAIQLR